MKQEVNRLYVFDTALFLSAIICAICGQSKYAAATAFPDL